MASASRARLHIAGAPKLFTIGQVINQLDGDYPGLTSSKLRFLEDEGLLTPQRTSSGYRKYTSDDIERLRIILELQNRKLPLKVILDYLSQLDAGVSASLPGDQEAPEPVLRKLRARKISRIELTAETGITEAMIADKPEPKAAPAGMPVSGPLVDTFGRIATDLRVSLTDRCNLRCTYCMPEEGMKWLPRQEVLSYEEIRRVAKVCVDRFGVDGIRLTGLQHNDAFQRAGQIFIVRTQGVSLQYSHQHGLMQAEFEPTGHLPIHIGYPALPCRKFAVCIQRPFLPHPDVSMGMGGPTHRCSRESAQTR